MHSHDTCEPQSAPPSLSREEDSTDKECLATSPQLERGTVREISRRANQHATFLRNNFASLIATTALLLGCSVFVEHAKMGLTLFDFNDEAEQFIVGKLLTRGLHLYKDIFSHHGPFTYIIAHIYVAAVSYSDFSYIRLFQIILAAVSCLAVVFSSALKTNAARIWAGAIYLIILAPIWNLDELNALTYYAMSGLFIVIFLAQFVFPLVLGEEPKPAGSLISGAAAGLTLCCAYSNGPGLVFLCLATVPNLIASTRRRRLSYVVVWFSAGFFAAVAFVTGWIIRFADLRGYFIYHLYFNQHVFIKYVSFSITDVLRNISISLEPRSIVHTLAFSLMMCWAYIQLIRIGGDNVGKELGLKLGSLFALVLGVLFTNPRGFDSFIDAAFVTSNVALFSLSAAGTLELAMSTRAKARLLQSILLPLVAIILTYKVSAYALNLWGVPQIEFPRYVKALKPSSEPIYNFIRSITAEYGDLLVLNYGAQIYLKTDRLPASGNMFYLPQQADYNRSPIDGYRQDICADIARLPKVIWFLNRRLATLNAIDEYEPCTLTLITKNYTELEFGSPWYVRNDVFSQTKTLTPKNAPAELDLEPNTARKILRTSEELSPFAPIKLLVDPHNAERRIPLQRIGILFSTNGRRNSGSADLYLKSLNGSSSFRNFRLNALANNTYQFFDLDPNVYISGEIRVAEGGGISTWESHFLQGLQPWWAKSYTCIIYEYTDGSRRYSPVCPVM